MIIIIDEYGSILRLCMSQCKTFQILHLHVVVAEMICFLFVSNITSRLCTKFSLRVYFHYEDPSFVTPNPSCSSLSSVSFPSCIVDKCLSISASSVVVNRLHGVLALQKACQVCIRCESLFYCAEAFSSCSFFPPSLPHSG